MFCCCPGAQSCDEYSKYRMILNRHVSGEEDTWYCKMLLLEGNDIKVPVTDSGDPSDINDIADDIIRIFGSYGSSVEVHVNNPFSVECSTNNAGSWYVQNDVRNQIVELPKQGSEWGVQDSSIFFDFVRGNPALGDFIEIWVKYEFCTGCDTEPSPHYPIP